MPPAHTRRFERLTPLIRVDVGPGPGSAAVQGHDREIRMTMERSLPVLSVVALAFSGGCRDASSPEEVFTTDAYVHTRVSWSPDSRWIAFWAAGSLYKMLASGDSLTRLTTGTNDIRPAWSHDGSQIAFVRTGISLLRIDSLTARLLSTTGNFPSWHPNGAELVAMEVGQQILNLEFLQNVDAISIASGEHRNLYAFGSSDICGFGSISPAGDRYVFSVRRENGQAQIWIVDLATSTPTRLTSDGGDYPAWSPDGRMIAYTRTAQGDGALWIMQADGSGKRRLTSP